MANRAFKMILNSLVERLTFIEGNFAVGESGGVGTVKGGGVKSVTHAGTGCYVIRLDDAYNRFLSSAAGLIAVPGSPNDDGSFNSGAINQIDAVGTQTGALTITAPTAAHDYGATINGLSASIVSSGVAVLDAAALALLFNGIYVTITPAVPGAANAVLAVSVPEEKLGYSGASGNFTVGEIVTGGTSGATGRVVSGNAATPLIVCQVQDGALGDFAVGEVITGTTSTSTATLTSNNPTSATVNVNVYPADNNVPYNGIGALVKASAAGPTVDLVYQPVPGASPVPNPAITTVAINSAGSAAAFAEATMPATDWYAVGLDPGLVPTQYMAFLFTGVGGSGDGTAFAVSATSTAAMAFQIQGDPNLTIGSGKGGFHVMLVRSDVGALVDPPDGSVVGFHLFLRNSTIKGQGE
jgi:hypothetical protein